MGFRRSGRGGSCQVDVGLHTLALPLQLAFSAVSVALRLYAEDVRRGTWQVHHGVIRKEEGSGPNDPGSYHLDGYMGLQIQPGTQPVTSCPVPDASSMQ